MKLWRSALVKAGVAIIILGGGITTMQLLASSKAEANKREVEIPVRKVETLVPAFSDISYLVEGNGLIESAGSLSVFSSLSGKVVYSYHNLASGTYVEKDEILLQIDSRQAKNTLNLARAELITAVAAIVPQFKGSNEQLYNKWNNYLDSLNFQTIVTTEIPRVTDSREKLLISTYGIYSTYYTARNAEILLEEHTVIAPFDGYISGQGILAGSYIHAGQPLMTLVDAEHLKVSVPLSVDDLNRIDSEGNPSVGIYPSTGNDTVLTGYLKGRDMLMDSASQMVNVYVEFSNPELDPRFAPGNYVDILIEGRILNNVAPIPRYAVIDNQFVYTYKDSILGKENISIRAVSNDTVYIDNNLPADTEIVTTILQKPLIGMKLSSLSDEGDE